MNGGPSPGLLESLRRQVGALEIVVATESGTVIAVSKGLSSDVVPDDVPGEVLLQVRQGRPFVSLEPQPDGGYLVRTAVPIGEPLPGSERLVLQAVYPVAERLGALADTVQAAYKQFGEKDYLRKPLKASFILTLTVVLLLSLLAAWYGAIFTAQKLVQPIQDLVKGTRAVARGRPRHAPAAHVARRDGLPRAFVQRHDQAAAPGPRGPAPRAAGGGDRARQPRRDPRAPLHRRGVARARPARAHGEPRREHDPRRGPRGARRPRTSARSVRARACCGSSSRPAARGSPPATSSGASSSAFQAGSRPPRRHVRVHAAAGRRRCAGRLRAGVRRHHRACCRRSARPPGARWRAASRTRSRTR